MAEIKRGLKEVAVKVLGEEWKGGGSEKRHKA